MSIVTAANYGKGPPVPPPPSVDALAVALHKDWQKTSGFTERWKTVKNKDDFWKVAHRAAGTGVQAYVRPATFEIDIQNLPFHFLTEQWQQENRATAELVINQVKGVGKTKLDKKDVLKIATAIHEDWLRRNTWVSDSDPMKAPFSALSWTLKMKDVQPVLTYLRLSGQDMKVEDVIGRKKD